MPAASEAIYERRQFGWTIIVAMLIAIGIAAAFGVVKTNGEASPWAIILFVVLVTMSLFSSMTVRVTPGELAWWMGSMRGFGKTIPVEQIASVEPIRTHLWDGWGIHLTTHGWLWNVSGFNAVEIKLTNGSRFAIGTPEPKALTTAIKRARKKNR
ncbi:MAG: hypothetical protein ACRENA_08290 [Vulcanimicrobiaceae bacterium]